MIAIIGPLSEFELGEAPEFVVDNNALADVVHGVWAGILLKLFGARESINTPLEFQFPFSFEEYTNGEFGNSQPSGEANDTVFVPSGHRVVKSIVPVIDILAHE